MSHDPKVQYYAPGEFIVTGDGQEIDGLSRSLRERRGRTVTELSRLKLSPTRKRLTEVAIALFSIDDGTPVEEVVAGIPVDYPGLSADPNYVVGAPPVPLTGDPWGVEGSPWGVEGSPWDHDTPTGTGGLAVAQDDFVKQWALGPQGICLYNDTGNPTTTQVGQRVRIGILDTSPFPAEGDYGIDWAVRPFQLRVKHPQLSDLQAPPSPPSPTGAPNINYHGLFVAGLANAVAGKSEIYLIRALDDYGQSYVYPLCQALQFFVVNVVADRMLGQLDGAVINLSLGIPLAVTDPAGQATVAVTSLDTALQTAYECGLVVVAAAGNDSWGRSSPRQSQLPARYPYVMAVQASAMSGGRACFSNLGSIAAPGCGLLSLLNSAPPSTTPVPYAYWAGTSFSTALVSGLAALVAAAGTSWNSADVVAAIYNNKAASPDATLSGGIVSVANTVP
jgi:hypothetical protein